MMFSSMAIHILIVLLSLISILQVEATIECKSPWQKVNDDICLLLNSGAKSYNHANFLCHFYDSNLLFINNDQEQNQLKNYLKSLIRYRFNQKQYLWLDATKKYDSKDWFWSNNNQQLNYTNWAEYSPTTNEIRSKVLNCACFRLKDGLWRDCDCDITNHFICRKSSNATETSLLRKPSQSIFATQASSNSASMTATTSTTTPTTNTTPTTTSSSTSSTVSSSTMKTISETTTTTTATTTEKLSVVSSDPTTTSTVISSIQISSTVTSDTIVDMLPNGQTDSITTSSTTSSTLLSSTTLVDTEINVPSSTQALSTTSTSAPVPIVKTSTMESSTVSSIILETLQSIGENKVLPNKMANETSMETEKKLADSLSEFIDILIPLNKNNNQAIRNGETTISLSMKKNMQKQNIAEKARNALRLLRSRNRYFKPSPEMFFGDRQLDRFLDEERFSKKLSLSTKAKEQNEISNRLVSPSLTRSRNSVLSNEEKNIIISSKIIMNDEDRRGLTEANVTMNAVPKLNNVIKSPFGEVIVTKMVAKISESFSLFECPEGFGFYSIAGTECVKFKRCDDWDMRNAKVTLNKCPAGFLFSFSELRCVTSEQYECENKVDKFVSITEF